MKILQISLSNINHNKLTRPGGFFVAQILQRLLTEVFHVGDNNVRNARYTKLEGIT